jgi:hypothetical protein
VWDARNGKLIANFAGGMANFDSMGSLRGKGRLSLRPTRHAVEYNATRSGVKPSRKRAEDVRDHQLRNDLLSKKGHLHAVVALCCTDNVVISGSKDMTIKIWDARTDRHVTTLRGHRGQITSLCTSLDSKVLFSSSADRTIKMWDLTGTSNTALICTARGHSHWVSDVCFESTSGCLLSSSFDCKIKAWKHCIDKKNKDQAEGKRTGGEENVLEDPCPVGRLLFANVLLADHSSVEEEDTQVVVDAMWWEDLEGGVVEEEKAAEAAVVNVAVAGVTIVVEVVHVPHMAVNPTHLCSMMMHHMFAHKNLFVMSLRGENEKNIFGSSNVVCVAMWQCTYWRKLCYF